MFVSDQLVYLQLQKTGCTHVADTLESVIGGERDRWEKHGRMPDRFDPEDRIIVVSVRNPWDWYVSLWAFGCSGRGGLYNDLTSKKPLEAVSQAVRNPTKMAQSVGHQLFKPVDDWKRVYADWDDPELFQEWLHRLLETEFAYAARGRYLANPISRFAGLFTHRYVQLTTAAIDKYRGASGPKTLGELLEFDEEYNVVDDFIRLEHVEEDLIRVLDSTGYDLSEEQLEEIRNRTATNTSDRRETSYYYDSRSRDLVELKETLIVEKYGYGFPGG